MVGKFCFDEASAAALRRTELQIEVSSWRIWSWVREHRHSMDSQGAAKRIQRHMRHAVSRITRERDSLLERLAKAVEHGELWRKTAKQIEVMLFDAEAAAHEADEANAARVRQLERELGSMAVTMQLARAAMQRQEIALPLQKTMGQAIQSALEVAAGREPESEETDCGEPTEGVDLPQKETCHV